MSLKNSRFPQNLQRIFLSLLLAIFFLSTTYAINSYIKRSVDGNTSTVDIGFDITTDSSGNIYATACIGESTGSVNLWVGKYDSALNLISSVTVNGSGNGTDIGKSIIVNSDGDVLVAGIIDETVGGTNIWVGRFNSSLVLQSSVSVNTGGSSDNGEGIAVDESGNIYVTGNINTGSAGKGNAIAVDGSGNIYVAGQLSETGQGLNIFVEKLNSSLVLQSSASFNGATNGIDVGNGIALGSDGSVYVTGKIINSASNDDIWLGKFNSSLVLQSTTTVNGPGDSIDLGDDITFGVDGKIYVTGYINQSGFDDDIWLGQFDSTLTKLSTSTISGDAINSADGGSGVITYNNYVYLTGNIDETTGGDNILISRHSIFGTASLPSTTLSVIKAFPNPFRPSVSQSSTMHFTNMPAGARIRVMSLTGELVREMTAGADGSSEWNAKNESGESVASGVYYVFVEGADDQKTFKVAIQR
jgi:Beta-propeller repeat